MGKLRAMPRGSFYLAFLYLIWSILPHFHVLVHSHQGGTGTHTHLSFSAADVALANAALEALGPGALKTGTEAEFSLDGGRSPAVVPFNPAANGIATGSASPFDTSLKTPKDGRAHSHFWEDANLAGMMSWPALALLAFIAIPYFLRRHLAPIADRSGLTWARGPPACSPA